MVSHPCFVISPIGEPDSPTRRHADAVLECIVEPALKSLGLEPLRADRIAAPGRITNQMIEAILQSPVCVVVLAEQNPNVYYELAVAQAARKRVVLLNLDGEPLPFDIKDYRCVHYTLEPVNIHRGVHRSALESHLRAVLADDYQVPTLVPASQERNQDAEPYWITTRANDFGHAPKYEALVNEATDYVCLAGLSLSSWANSESFGSIERALERGIGVRMLLASPHHAMLDHLINTGLALQSPDKIRELIAGTLPRFQELSRRFDKAEVRVLTKGLLTSALLVTDKVALVVQYPYSLESGNSPMFRYPSGTTLHRVALGEFDALWQANAPG